MVLRKVLALLKEDVTIEIFINFSDYSAQRYKNFSKITLSNRKRFENIAKFPHLLPFCQSNEKES